MIAVIGQLEKNLPRGGGYVFSFLKKYPFRMVVMTVRTDSFPLIVDEKPHVKAKSIHPLGNEEEKAVAVHDALIHRSMLNVLPLVTVSRSSDSLFFFSTKERMCCTKPFEATRSQTDKANCNVLLLLSALSRNAIICLHVS
jgi:hypothetical protein